MCTILASTRYSYTILTSTQVELYSSNKYTVRVEQFKQVHSRVVYNSRKYKVHLYNSNKYTGRVVQFKQAHRYIFTINVVQYVELTSSQTE